MENDPHTWPLPLYAWLHEYEGYSLRSERLYDDIDSGDAKRMFLWLLAAYEVGYKAAKNDCCGHAAAGHNQP